MSRFRETLEVNKPHERRKFAQCYRSYKWYFVILLVSTFVCIILSSILLNMQNRDKPKTSTTTKMIESTTKSPTSSSSTFSNTSKTIKTTLISSMSPSTASTTIPSDPSPATENGTEFATSDANCSTTKTTTIITSTPPNHSTDPPNDPSLPIIIPYENTTNICDTEYCRQIASKMRSYMNNSADPCNDFHEYACGGFKANSQWREYQVQSSIYQRIKKQMMKEKQENVSSIFATYYDSCMKYEKTMSLYERKEMASIQLKKIGEFHIDSTACKNTKFTDLFAQLILHHSALLFDIVPEIDEDRHNFTLKISPTTYRSFFEGGLMNFCGNNFEMDSNYEDSEPLCSNKRHEKNDRQEIKRSVSEALTELSVFKNLRNSTLEWERINETLDAVHCDIMQEYFSNISSENNNEEVYLTNDYDIFNLTELQEDNTTLINWKQLLELLLETNNITNKNIQVYFHKKLGEGLALLSSLTNSTATNCMNLNNAIMALYARKLYQELVLSQRNNEEHCLQMATNLLRHEATNLYISSFADHEIKRMDERTTNMFNKLKQTLKYKIKNATWSEGNSKDILLKKTESLELALPPVAYFKNRSLLYNDYNMSQNISPQNYFINSINLMKGYRALMYTEIKRKFDISKQIWTYYTTPFQLQTKMIYCLNKIAIPYGIIELHSASNEDFFNYVTQTKLGNLIVHQIVHYFDNLDNWNKNVTENNHFESFKNISVDIDVVKRSKPLSNQIECSKLMLNEKMSEIIKFRLLKETLNYMMPQKKLYIDKLFYLAYVQEYCSKSPLALRENGNLRNRDRVNVIKANDRFFAKTWNCSESRKPTPKPKDRKCNRH